MRNFFKKGNRAYRTTCMVLLKTMLINAQRHNPRPKRIGVLDILGLTFYAYVIKTGEYEILHTP